MDKIEIIRWRSPSTDTPPDKTRIITMFDGGPDSQRGEFADDLIWDADRECWLHVDDDDNWWPFMRPMRVYLWAPVPAGHPNFNDPVTN